MAAEASSVGMTAGRYIAFTKEQNFARMKSEINAEKWLISTPEAFQGSNPTKIKASHAQLIRGNITPQVLEKTILVASDALAHKGTFKAYVHWEGRASGFDNRLSLEEAAHSIVETWSNQKEVHYNTIEIAEAAIQTAPAPTKANCCAKFMNIFGFNIEL